MPQGSSAVRSTNDLTFYLCMLKCWLLCYI